MSDLSDLYTALQNADAAGDTASAQQLADYIRSQSSTGAPDRSGWAYPNSRSYDAVNGQLVPTGSPQALAAQSLSNPPIYTDISKPFTGSSMLPNGQPKTGNPAIDNTITGAFTPLPSDAEVGRNIGLGLRNVVQGITGLVTGPLDAIGQGINFVQNPHVPSWQELNPFSAQGASVGSGAHDFSADVSGALDRDGFPQPQNAVERWAGFGQQLLAGPMLGAGLFGGGAGFTACLDAHAKL
jgi:hypothetical protein